MLSWILAALVVHMVYILVPFLIFFAREGFMAAAGPRDKVLEATVMQARAKRALANQFETLPIFLSLGILAMVVPEADLGQASTGAMLYVLARVIYLPLYVAGVPLLRTAAWFIALVGILMMGFALL